MKTGACIVISLIIALLLICAITTATVIPDKIGLFRPSTGKWYFDLNLDGLTDRSFTWGTSGDVPLTGDFFRDGNTDIALFRPSTGKWYFDWNLDGLTDRSYTWGTSGDIPLIVDFNSDGYPEMALFRPSNSKWYFDLNLDGLTDRSYTWGASGDIPLTADFNHDGYPEMALFRPSTGKWYFDYGPLNGVTDKSYTWGTSGDIPFTGYFNSDGYPEMALFRPSTGKWYFDYGPPNGVTEKSFTWGTNGDIPLTGYFNGDGLTDIVLFRPSTGKWYFDYGPLNGVTDKSYTWGTSGDKPVVGKWTPPSSHIISGYVYDGSFPYGTKKGISGALVTYGNVNTVSDTTGFFSFSIMSGPDPELSISAPGFHNYKETPSRMVNGGFHLIPDSVYRGVYLVVWDPQENNPQNFLREWNKQTLFVIVQKGASTEQVNDLMTILKTDKYRNMTGGRFSSAAPPVIADEKPADSDREGKTIISFSPGIPFGGIAHSASFDGSGVINYAEITWDTGQQIEPTFVWHEMVHTVTAGGHINEWPSVVSEIEGQGIITSTDEKIFNCIYNSPPRRSN